MAENATGSPAFTGGLSFRLAASGQDHRALIDLVEAGHRESRFGYVPFSREKAVRQLDRALAEDARHLIAVAEVRGVPQGFVFASAGEYHVGTGVLIVTINAIYVAADLRGSLLGGRASVGLFGSVERWARGIGAAEVLLHLTGGIGTERVERVVRRLGFRGIGGSFVARLGSGAHGGQTRETTGNQGVGRGR